MPPEVEEVREWIRKARQDQWMAEAGLERDPPLTAGAAFHCQQAVEKYIKAFLAHRQIQFERIHDLRSLLEQCVASDAAWEALRDRVEPLTAYAVRFRYPGPPDPSEAETQEAFGVVREVAEFLQSRVPAFVWE